MGTRALRQSLVSRFMAKRSTVTLPRSPPHVLAEAEQAAQNTVASLTKEQLAAREDFRGLPIVTIDGETARDFDDAVLVRPLPNGNTELQVHIASNSG